MKYRIQLDKKILTTEAFDVEADSLDEAVSKVMSGKLAPTDSIIGDSEIEAVFHITDDGGTETLILINEE